MICMVLEYCLLSRRRHYMISESYFLLHISHLPNIFISKKGKVFPKVLPMVIFTGSNKGDCRCEARRESMFSKVHHKLDN